MHLILEPYPGLYATEKSFGHLTQTVKLTILFEFFEDFPPHETVRTIFFIFPWLDDGFESVFPREFANELSVISGTGSQGGGTLATNISSLNARVGLGAVPSQQILWVSHGVLLHPASASLTLYCFKVGDFVGL